jgi:hypothetical protein
MKSVAMDESTAHCVAVNQLWECDGVVSSRCTVADAWAGYLGALKGVFRTATMTAAFALLCFSALGASAQTLPTCQVPPGPNGAFLYDNNGLSCLAAHNVVYASAFSGSDPCAQINAAIKALPSTGGTVDARGFQGTQSCASNPFAGITSDVELLLGDVAIQTTVPWVTPSAQNVLVIGSGRGGSGHGTTIRAVTGFPSTCDGLSTGCPVVRLGSGTTAFGHRIENLAIDCNSQTGAIGLYSTDIQEQSGAYHFLILSCPINGIKMDGSGAAGSGPFFAQNYELFDGEVYAQGAGSGSTVNVLILSSLTTVNGPRRMEHLTSNGQSGNVILSSYTLDGVVGHIQDLNAESSVTGYTFGGALPVQDLLAQNLQCQNVSTNCVWIKNPAAGVNDLIIMGVLNGANLTPTTIRDDTNGTLITDFTVGFYTTNSGNRYRLSTTNSPLVSSVLPALALQNNADSEQSFILDSGKTAQQGDVIIMRDRSAAKWNLEYTKPGGNFQLFDYVANFTRFRFAPNGQSFINSAGASALFVNNDVGSGTGGFSICNGGATCNFTVGGTGALILNAAATFQKQVQLADKGTCTMAAGTCAAQSLSTTYNTAPTCFLTWSGTGTLTGALKVASTTTTVTPSSSGGTDTARVNWVCFGN